MSPSALDLLLGDHAKGDPAGAATTRPEVLVVDDDVHVLRALRRILSIFYDVTIASSAMEALSAVSNRHSAVILDIRMPTHDGFWACEHIRERFPDVPIIFHTAHQSEKQVDVLIDQYKPFAYIMKNGDIDQLLATVEAAVTSGPKAAPGGAAPSPD